VEAARALFSRLAAAVDQPAGLGSQRSCRLPTSSTGSSMTPDLLLKFLAEAGTCTGMSIVSCLRWLNQLQPGHLGTMIIAVMHCLLIKSRMHGMRAMGGVAQLLSLLQSWSRKSTALLLASENRELKQSWELEADAILSIVCGPQHMGGLAQLVNCMHNAVHWWAPPSHVVEVCHCCNIVTAHPHCLALEEWEKGLEDVVCCGDFEHIVLGLKC